MRLLVQLWQSVLAGSAHPAARRRCGVNTKKLLLVLLVVFLGWWMFTDPDGLADSAVAAAEWAWSVLVTLFQGMIRFVDELV
jgi:hypothetical protein